MRERCFPIQGTWIVAVLFLLFCTACGPPTSPRSPTNRPPVIGGNKIAVAPVIITPGSTATLTVSATDPDGDALTFTWTAQMGDVPTGPRADRMITYRAPDIPSNDIVKVTVSDGRGGVAEASVTIRVVMGEPPTKTPTPSPTPTSTPTLTPLPPTDTPTPAPTATSTLIPVSLPTATLIPIPLPTPAPTTLPSTPIPQPAPTLTGWIAFPVCSAPGKGCDLYWARPDGSDRRQLVSQASQPAISPDGSRLAFRSWNDSYRGLAVMELASGEIFRVSLGFEDACPVWLPTGQIIFHTRLGDDTTPRLRKAGTETDVQKQDTVEELKRGKDHVRGQFPAVLPDGRIVYKYWEPSGNWRGLYVMNADGSNPWPLTDNVNDTIPAASPETGRIAFMSRSNGHWQIYAINPDGSDRRQLTDTATNSGLPTWSPNGTHIAFVSKRDGPWEMWVMNADGSGQHKLFDLGEFLDLGEERISWGP